MVKVAFAPEIDRRVTAYVTALAIESKLASACAGYTFDHRADGAHALTLTLIVDPYELFGIERDAPAAVEPSVAETETNKR